MSEHDHPGAWAHVAQHVLFSHRLGGSPLPCGTRNPRPWARIIPQRSQ